MEADKLRAELDAIDQAAEDEEPSEEPERHRDEIENRLDEIEAGKREFTSEQKSQAGVIVTIGHNGKPVYHCGLVERGAKATSTNGAESNAPDQEKEDLSAALLQDLTTQRTAALRATLSIRPDIALIAITHNLAAQIFYDQTYLLPSSLTVRADAHADGFDLRTAAESEAAKAIAEQTKDVRNLLPPKLDLLWDWALGQPQDVFMSFPPPLSLHHYFVVAAWMRHHFESNLVAVMDGDFDEKTGRATWNVYVPAGSR